MPSQHIRLSATTSAPPAVVHALLRDGAGWPSWSPIGAFTLERPAPGGGEDVGAIRRFDTGRIKSRERIVEIVADRRFSYVLESGLAIRDYRADVDLEPDGQGGTRIAWHSAFDPKTPGTGWLYRRQLTAFIDKLLDGLAARAGEEAAAGGSRASAAA